MAVVQQIVTDLLPGADIEWRGDEVVVRVGGELVVGVSAGNASDREAISLIADFVQDGAIEHFWRPVPECAGHPHPAVLRQTAEGFAWVCPVNGRVFRTYAVDDGPVAH